jgi:hypothetical protein
MDTGHALFCDKRNSDAGVCSCGTDAVMASTLPIRTLAPCPRCGAKGVRRVYGGHVTALPAEGQHFGLIFSTDFGFLCGRCFGKLRSTPHYGWRDRYGDGGRGEGRGPGLLRRWTAGQLSRRLRSRR